MDMYNSVVVPRRWGIEEYGGGFGGINGDGRRLDLGW